MPGRVGQTGAAKRPPPRRALRGRHQFGGLRARPARTSGCSWGGALDAVAAQPAQVRAASRTQPAAHGARRATKLSGDAPPAATLRLGQRRRADDLGGVGTPGQQRSGQQHLGGPAGGAPGPAGRTARVDRRVGAPAGSSRATRAATYLRSAGRPVPGGEVVLDPVRFGHDDHPGVLLPRVRSLAYHNRARQGVSPCWSPPPAIVHKRRTGPRRGAGTVSAAATLAQRLDLPQTVGLSVHRVG